MSVAVISGTSVRSATAPVGANGSVTGTQTNSSGGAAVAGGTVQLIQGATTVTQTPDGSGNYTFSNVAPGAYTLMNHPPIAYSIADAGLFSISVSSGGTTTQNLSVQSALYIDTFQSYTTTAQLTNSASPRPVGDFFYWLGNTTYEIASPANAGRAGDIFELDKTTCPAPLAQAMHYHFAVWNGGVHGSPNNVNVGPRLNPMPVTGKLYIRFTDYISGTFQNGGSGATGSDREYKFFLSQFGPNNGGLPQIGLYIEGDDPTYKICMDVTDRTNSINTTHAQQHALGSLGTWTGKWNTWVMECILGGASPSTFNLYLQGTAIFPLSGTFLPSTTTVGGNQVWFPNIGEQLNNGPDQAWDRWWGEFGMYTTRPSLLPMVP